jgi:hypothetical protein
MKQIIEEFTIVKKSFLFDEKDITLALINFKKIKNSHNFDIKLEFKVFGITLFFEKKNQSNEISFEIPFDKDELLHILAKFFKIELVTITGHVDNFQIYVEDKCIELSFRSQK